MASQELMHCTQDFNMNTFIYVDKLFFTKMTLSQKDAGIISILNSKYTLNRNS